MGGRKPKVKAASFDFDDDERVDGDVPRRGRG